MQKFKSFTIAFTLLVNLACLNLISCSKPETKIDGEAFIVTQGAGNYKLGLVQIAVIPEAAARALVDAKKSNDEVEAKAKYDQSKQKVFEASQNFDKVSGKYDDQSSSVKAGVHSENIDTLRQSLKTLDEMKWTEGQVNDAKNNLENARQKAAQDYADLVTTASPEKYFASLPPAIVTAQTNADGKFSLTIPKPGKYAIVARAERKIDDKKSEFYYWFFWINADGKPQSLILGNNNTTDSGFPDSAVKSNIYEP